MLDANERLDRRCLGGIGFQNSASFGGLHTINLQGGFFFFFFFFFVKINLK